jgi:hypothetical protein
VRPRRPVEHALETRLRRSGGRHAGRLGEPRCELAGPTLELGRLRPTLLGLPLEGRPSAAQPLEPLLRRPQRARRPRLVPESRLARVLSARPRNGVLCGREHGACLLERAARLRLGVVEVRALAGQRLVEGPDSLRPGSQLGDGVAELGERPQPLSEGQILLLELHGEGEASVHDGTLTWRPVSGYEVQLARLDALVRFLGGIVRSLRRFAFVAVFGVAAIGALLARNGVEPADVVLTVMLLAPPAVLLFFTAGVAQLLRLPERVRRMPRESATQLTALSRLAGETRDGGLRRAPRVLWKLRGAVGSTRDLVGLALPLRVLTPAFLGFSLLAAFLCLILIAGGAIALIALAAG